MSLNPQAALFDRALIVPFSYDECVERLAYTVDRHEDARLEELAYLISQLAVVIE
jgi:hypothetical protein